MVNQHAYGIPAAHSPVFCLRQAEVGDMVGAYLGSFERVWAQARAYCLCASSLKLSRTRCTVLLA
jgi:hypothetical protein